MIPIIAGLALMGGVGAGYAGLASAQTTTADALGTTTAVHRGDREGRGAGKHAALGNDGVVTSVTGTTIVMNEEADEGGAAYTVDASGATVRKNGATSTVSAITVGDKIFVKGTVTGTSVVATEIRDGRGAKGNHSGHKGRGWFRAKNK